MTVSRTCENCLHLKQVTFYDNDPDYYCSKQSSGNSFYLPRPNETCDDFKELSV